MSVYSRLYELPLKRQCNNLEPARRTLCAGTPSVATPHECQGRRPATERSTQCYALPPLPLHVESPSRFVQLVVYKHSRTPGYSAEGSKVSGRPQGAASRHRPLSRASGDPSAPASRGCSYRLRASLPVPILVAIKRISAVIKQGYDLWSLRLDPRFVAGKLG